MHLASQSVPLRFELMHFLVRSLSLELAKGVLKIIHSQKELEYFKLITIFCLCKGNEDKSAFSNKSGICNFDKFLLVCCLFQESF